ncbi:MAG: sigma-70 family RNA polymerase sigma factor [Bacteroidia bacterium]|jgi:RNA polymerase sigma-70 factor (ECF subfamily)|nr:sigma-70 family RNA polymerase sigma factor [Bacteroidia bacterium]
MNDLSDIQLLQQFRQASGDSPGAALRQQIFKVLVTRYQKKLYWHIRRMLVDHDDTDDVLQNTFIKVWRALDGFKEDAQLYTWLYRIATNETLSFIRQRKADLQVRFGDVEYSIENKLQDDNFFCGDEIQKKLQLAIQTLPEKQRLVFNMKYFEEMRYEDMSAVLDTSVGALKASYHHAVKKIEAYIRNTSQAMS